MISINIDNDYVVYVLVCVLVFWLSCVYVCLYWYLFLCVINRLIKIYLL